MKYDRKLMVTVGNSRKSMNWVGQQTTVEAFYARMGQVARGKETVAEYFRMKKADQDNLKDVQGGYVGGVLKGPRRLVSAVMSRSLITLDFDNIPAFGVDNIIAKLDLCGFSYCVYSTRKHTQNAPRLRVLVVTDRDMTTDEYEPCARRVAEYIGIDKADPTTFELHRLFYFPTACADGEFVYKVKDAPFAKVDKLLSSYKDWHDVTEWPQVPGFFNYRKEATKAGDPVSKHGIVGAFCRVYDIYRAMDELIPGIYAPVDNADNRYTYLNGSTAGGAVVYENGKFLYSHHATDPCSGKLVNAFDLVRLHKFGHLDEDVDPVITPVNRMPSYKQMSEFANGLDDVAALILKERMQGAADDFKDLPGVGMDTSLTGQAGNVAQNATSAGGATQTQGGRAADQSADADAAVADASQADAPTDINWMLKLDRDRNNKILNTMDNILLIMENDPNLKARFALNEFSGRGEVLAALPWARDYRGRRMWSDTDSNGLYWYLEKVYQINGRGNIDSALDIHASTHSFNDVTDFLDKLKWDGKPRLDNLFHDYLGAEDSEYVRAVCRKTFCGAIARAYRPGCKFDTMLILCGPQGIGKSTLIDKMSKGWYNDSIRTFEGKDASELLQGVWLVEVAELDAFRRTDVACIKQFLSLRVDRYRAAYGRNVKEYPRRCIFFGTCNQMEFLQDTTGNRRFWPVDVGVAFAADRRSVFKDLTDDVIQQVWAEAKIRYQMGEELFLTGELDAIAQKAQEDHRESAAQEGMIIDFLNREVPSDWIAWPIARRRDYWAGAVKKDDIVLVPRDRVCSMEVWAELFNKNPADVRKQESAMVNAIINRQADWKRSTVRCGPYGDSPIKGFIRVHKKG